MIASIRQIPGPLRGAATISPRWPVVFGIAPVTGMLTAPSAALPALPAATAARPSAIPERVPHIAGGLRDVGAAPYIGGGAPCVAPFPRSAAGPTSGRSAWKMNSWSPTRR